MSVSDAKRAADKELFGKLQAAEADIAAMRNRLSATQTALYEKYAQHHGCKFQTGAPCDGCVRAAHAAMNTAQRSESC